MVLVLTDRPEQTDVHPGGRATVPWATVAAFAVVFAVADGFWLTTVRGAVGAIERTQSPFVGWLRGSALLMPVYALAVVAVMAIALHRMWVRSHSCGSAA